MVEEEGAEFQNLPEGCIASVLSLTTPRDVCRLSLVCSTFRSAAESDAVWDKFLPSDYRTLISQSENATSVSTLSKKDIYLSLSQNPILIDDGKKSFQLEKEYGKKCYMLSARILSIVWGDTPRYWRWTSLPEARFSEVAQLLHVCWLEIRGRINTAMLSPKTLYGAYLVFKPCSQGAQYGFDHQLVEVYIGIAGGDTQMRTVYLDAERERRIRYQIVPRRAGSGMFRGRYVNADEMFRPRFAEVQVPALVTNLDFNPDQYPKQRGDGWLEVELGQYFNEGGEDNELEMTLLEIKGGDWKGGIFVQGIEIRPKVCP